MIGNELTLNSPLYSLVYGKFLMTPMFSISTIAIKFDCLFLTIFKVFIYLLVLFLTN